MRFDLLAVSLKNLKRKRFRTSILVFSLGLLVSILVFGASFIISVRSTIDRASDRLGADLLIVPVGARELAQEVLLETKNKLFYMPRSILDRVKDVEGIESYTYHTYLTSILGVCCDVPEAHIVAFDQDTDFILAPWINKNLGRRLEKGEAILGYMAAENLQLLEVDSSVLFNLKFDFVGVLEKTGTGLDDAIFVLDDNVKDMARAANLKAGVDEISVIFAKVKDGYTSEEVGWNVEEDIVEVDIIKRHDMGAGIIGILEDINKLFTIIVILAAVISTFLAWSVFSAIANERVREVGIMRAIGAKCSHVMKMFVMEVILIGVLGSIVGVICGTLMSVAMSGSFAILRDLSATMTMPERVFVAVFGLVAGSLICLVGAYSSMMRLRNLDPLRALKEI